MTKTPPRSFLYAIGIGSNRAGRAARSPRGMVEAALIALDDAPLTLLDASPIMNSAPVGPSLRRYANCAALVATPMMPDEVMAVLLAIEDGFGRKRYRKWGARALDLDLLLWSEGSFVGDGVVVPHPEIHTRDFVLLPLAQIAPDWHDPLTGLSILQLLARLRRAKPVDQHGAAD